MLLLNEDESSDLILGRLSELEARFQQAGHQGAVFSDIERSRLHALRDHPDPRVKSFAASLALRMR